MSINDEDNVDDKDDSCETDNDDNNDWDYNDDNRGQPGCGYAPEGSVDSTLTTNSLGSAMNRNLVGFGMRYGTKKEKNTKLGEGLR